MSAIINSILAVRQFFTIETSFPLKDGSCAHWVNVNVCVSKSNGKHLASILSPFCHILTALTASHELHLDQLPRRTPAQPEGKQTEEESPTIEEVKRNANIWNWENCTSNWNSILGCNGNIVEMHLNEMILVFRVNKLNNRIKFHSFSTWWNGKLQPYRCAPVPRLVTKSTCDTLKWIN